MQISFFNFEINSFQHFVNKWRKEVVFKENENIKIGDTIFPVFLLLGLHNLTLMVFYVINILLRN